MDDKVNTVELCGTVLPGAAFSHLSHGRAFWRFTAACTRLSGAVDEINIIAPDNMAASLSPGQGVHITGELRSFNNHSGTGSRLVVTVYARRIELGACEPLNSVALSGRLCRKPVYRSTPLGREICDFILAVERQYGRSDYLPCIAWGAGARMCAELDAGGKLSLRGRIQSRTYTKLIEGAEVLKTAYEISVMESHEQNTLSCFRAAPLE